MDGYPLGRILRESTGLPVTIENDAMCAALGEYAVGALKGVSLGLMVVIGTGLGGAIVVDGHILRGAHNLAGTVCFVSNDVRKPVTFGSVYGDVTSWRALRDRCVRRRGLIRPMISTDIGFSLGLKRGMRTLVAVWMHTRWSSTTC